MSANRSYDEPQIFGIPSGLSFVTAFVAVLAYASAFHGPQRLPLAILCLLGGYLAVSLAHQGGHVLAALLCRWRIVLVVVRRIGFQVPNRNLLFMPWRYDNGGGGWVEAVPRHAAAGSKTAWAIIIMAGPLANILLAAFAIRASVSILPPPSDTSFVPANFFVGLAVQALHAVLRSLFAASEACQSSGQQLQRLFKIKRGDFAKARPVWWIGFLLQNRVRLRNIPDWMIDECRRSAAQDEAIARYLDGVEVGRFLDNPPFDVAAARALLEHYRQLYGTTNWLASCDAYVAVIWEDDPARAEAALGEVQPPSEVPAMTLAAEAALAAWLGDAGTVQAKLADMRKALKAQSPFRDDTFLDLTGQIEALLARKLASPVLP